MVRKVWKGIRMERKVWKDIKNGKEGVEGY